MALIAADEVLRLVALREAARIIYLNTVFVDDDLVALTSAVVLMTEGVNQSLADGIGRDFGNLLFSSCRYLCSGVGSRIWGLILCFCLLS